MKDFARAERLNRLPPYLFVEIDRMRDAAVRSGQDIVDLGVGDPDLPTPGAIVEALAHAARDARHHRYPPSNGLPEFREEIARWFHARFDVTLDPQTEILPLLGSKEGIGHTPLAVVNPGDRVLVPDPGYPVYRSSTIFAGGEPVTLPLRAENGFLPDLEAIPASDLRGVRLLFINYPNNPTSAVAEYEFYERAVRFAEKHGIFIVSDAAYCETTFDGFRAPSLLQVPGGKDVGIEIHSLSKTFNMTGWRIGYAVGHADILRALHAVKSNLDSGAFGAVQMAALAALRLPHEVSAQIVETYRVRRDVMMEALHRAGCAVPSPRGTFFIWAPVPAGERSMDFVARLLRETAVVATPGVGFGEHGEGWFRLSMTSDVERVREAGRRLVAYAPWTGASVGGATGRVTPS
jgi:LL-diaminopimelate aminotransferase